MRRYSECLAGDWTYINKFWITSSLPVLYVIGFAAIGAVAYMHYLLNKKARPFLHGVYPGREDIENAALHRR